MAATLLIPVENQVRELDARLLLACVAAEHNGVRAGAALAPILSSGSTAKMIEGPIDMGGPDSAEGDAPAQRSYVLKISRYNNIDPEVRDRDLDRINSAALLQTSRKLCFKRLGVSEG